MYGNTRTVIPVTIASGQSLSAEVTVGAKRIVGIQMPAGWDAAGISFAALTRQSAAGVGTFGKVQDNGGVEVVLITPGADIYVSVGSGTAPAVSLYALGRVKVRSGTLGAPVTQTAQRDFFLVCTDY